MEAHQGPGLWIFFEIFFQGFVRIVHHCLELVAGENLAVSAYSLVGKNHSAPVADTHHNGKNQKYWGNKYGPYQGNNQVKYHFQHTVIPPRQVILGLDNGNLLHEKCTYLKVAHWSSHNRWGK